MSEHSRRTFLRGAGVSAAAVTVAAVLPSGIASASENNGETGAPATTNPVVAYVTNPSSGTITVMHGEKEVVVTDKGLARRIAKLAP